MASISINPTSNGFTSDGGSGSISVTVETANWSSTPSDNAVWMAMRKRTNLIWSAWSIIKIKGEDGEDGLPGDDGRGIRRADTTYKKGTNATTPPTGEWSTTPVAINAGEYLWTRTIFTYTDGTTSDPAYSVARWGEDGDSGTATKSPTMVYSGYYHKDPRTGEYNSDIAYFGNEDLISVVYHNGQYYKANSNAGTTGGMFKDSASSPASSSNWTSFGASFDSIATGVVFAEQAYLDNAIVRILETAQLNNRGYIVAQNDVLTMYDSSNNPKLVISGEDLGALQDSFDQESFTGRTEYASASQREVSSTITLWSPTVSSTPNTFTLPPMTITITKDSSAEEFIEAEAFYYVDGDIVSGNTIRGELTYNRTTTMTIPGKTLSLTKGSHSIQLYMQAMTPDSTSLSSISASGVTLDITYTMQAVEIGANGFRAAFSASQYALFTKDGSNAPVFTLLNGDYGFRVTSSGFQKTTTGDTGWTTFNL